MVARGKKLGGRESWGVWMRRYTLLHLKWIINKDLLTVQQSVLTILCSMLCGILDGRGIWGRTDTFIWMAESLWCPFETVTTLLIRYTPIQNKKCGLFFFLKTKGSRRESQSDSKY